MTLGQIPQNIIRGVIDDDHLRDLAERNKARAEQVIQDMAVRYCCHPKNRIQKLEKPL